MKNASLIACAFVTSLGVLAFSGTSQAALYTWTGTAGTNFADAGNWSPSGIPASNDYQDQVKFTENTPANKTPTLASGRLINKVHFDNSTGWTLGGGEILFKTVESTGAGTNTINTVKAQASNQTWIIGAGNTLIINTLVQDGTNTQTTLQGGGTLQVGGQVGYSYSTGKDYIIKENTTLRVNSSTVYSNATGVTHIAGEGAALILLTTVSTANGQIGTKIVDDLGYGLNVSDIGGGYVKIVSAIPEPASLGVVGAISLALVRRRRA